MWNLEAVRHRDLSYFVLWCPRKSYDDPEGQQWMMMMMLKMTVILSRDHPMRPRKYHFHQLPVIQNSSVQYHRTNGGPNGRGRHGHGVHKREIEDGQLLKLMRLIPGMDGMGMLMGFGHYGYQAGYYYNVHV
jgi:hypothetical protein